MSKTANWHKAPEILVVDDEADIRELIAGILNDDGYETRLAKDADGALGAVRARQPALVVLDIWLQGSRIDGLAVLEEIKRDFPDLPVIVISGHGTIETAVAAIKRGAYDFLEKPFKSDKLMILVEMEKALKEAGRGLTPELLKEAKRIEFPDNVISRLTGISQEEIKGMRHENGIIAAYKMVDTCAAEFAAETPYYYSCAELEDDFVGTGLATGNENS